MREIRSFFPQLEQINIKKFSLVIGKTFVRYLLDETFKRSAIINGIWGNIGIVATKFQQARVKLGFFYYYGKRLRGKWRKGDRKGEETRIRIAQ